MDKRQKELENKVAEEGIILTKSQLMRMLTGRGTEYCGSLENHAYELFLSIEGVDHSKTKAYMPQTNGICEQFNKTMKTSSKY